MRIYIIGNDGITLSREAPATVSEGETAVVSNEELHAARLSGKRLLALWNALPGVVAVAHFPLPLGAGQSIPRHHRPLATEPGGCERTQSVHSRVADRTLRC